MVVIHRQLYLIGLTALVAWADEICLGPSMPDLTHCVVCEDVRGSQCVSGDRWFSCYKTVEACCNDWSILNVQSDIPTCVADSEATMKEESDSEESEVDSDTSHAAHIMDQIPKVSNSICAEMVSTRPDVTTNSGCMTECEWLINHEGMSDPFEDESFSNYCAHAHWENANGRTKVTHNCFDKFVYGYSQESDLASYITGIIRTETPAQCQLACQLDEDCVNWVWASDILASTGQGEERKCLLKSTTQVEKALTIRTDVSPSPNMDAKFCNVNLPHECSTDHYNCLPCDSGEKRCVWESDNHVTGWRYCVATDKCSPDFGFNATTPAPVATTPTVEPSTALKSSTLKATQTPTQAPTTTKATTKQLTTPETSTTPMHTTTMMSTPAATRKETSTELVRESTNPTTIKTVPSTELTSKATKTSTTAGRPTTTETTTDVPTVADYWSSSMEEPTSTKLTKTSTKKPTTTTYLSTRETGTTLEMDPSTPQDGSESEDSNDSSSDSDSDAAVTTELVELTTSSAEGGCPQEEESDSDTCGGHEDSSSDDACRPSCHHHHHHHRRHRHHRHHHHHHHRHHKCSGPYCADGLEIRVADRPKKLELSIEN